MTRRSHSRTGAILARTGLLGACLVLFFCLLTGGVVVGAPSDLTLMVSSVDLSAYPQASFVLQLGGQGVSGLEDLAKGSVTLEVDGVAVPPDSVTAAGSGLAAPVNTMLVIDESGSMKGEAIKAAAAAAAAFVDAMRPGDTAAIAAFNEQFRTLQAATGDKAALKASLAGLDPQKDTALYDGLIEALGSFGTATPGTRYVILLSDGGDTASTAKLEQALTLVRSTGIPAYVIGLKSTEFESGPLASLAEASGGRYLETPDSGALTSLYQTLAKEIHNQYLVKFAMPASSVVAGTLKVAVAAGDQTIQAERGFFYPTTTSVASTTTTTATSATTVTSLAGAPALTEVSGNDGLVGRFIRWGASDYIVAAIVFLLVLFVVYALTSALLPRRDILGEYSGAIDRKTALTPRADDETVAKPGSLNRAASRLLAIRGYQDPLQRLINDADLKFRASEFALLQVFGVVVLAVVARLVGAPLALVVVVALVVALVPLFWLSARANGRRVKFNDQVPNTLTLIAGSLKAGQGFEQALIIAARESPQPTSSELQRALAQMRLGVTPEDALRGVAVRMRSEAFDWAVLSTAIQRQVGGNLAEIYESTAHTLRERAKLHRQIKTLTAEGKLSALILIILPFVIGGIVAIINRGYLAPLVATTMGYIMVAIAVVLMVVGIFWIRLIIRVDK